ncbi:cache domain-containing protein, partial [Roseibium algae]
MNGALFDERSNQTKSIVQMAISAADYYHKKELSGELTREEAQQQASDTITNLRYNGKGYVFAYGMDGTRIISSRADLIGTNAYDAKDASGKYHVREMIAAAKAGGGSVPYVVSRPGGKEPLPKISWAQAFKPWGWVL